MLGNRELVLDTFCEVHDLLKPWRDYDFWDFRNHTPVPGGIYLLGRKQFSDNTSRIRDLVEKNFCHIILSNPAEGSETLRGQCKMMGVEDLIFENKILIIGGGDMDSRYPCLQYDSFLPKVFDYEENLQASTQTDDIYKKIEKPYKFLFLNGRNRPHRRWLIDRFQKSQLINKSLWTNLDRAAGEIKYLPERYEVDRYRGRLSAEMPTEKFIKHHLFDNTWGDIYLTPEPYVDTYFSLVTETVFEYPYSFRTEKIWKPIAMGHPWIAVANYGYYRDLRNMGFQTFNGIIDEDFDKIENNQDRLERIAVVVEDICRQDLGSFLAACQSICKYNQQHLSTMRLRVRQEFPERFIQFISQYINVNE